MPTVYRLCKLGPKFLMKDHFLDSCNAVKLKKICYKVFQISNRSLWFLELLILMKCYCDVHYVKLLHKEIVLVHTL